MREYRAPRAKKRISCEIVLEDSRYSGIVLDLSATGLWVQTNAKFVQATTAARARVTVTVNLSVAGRDERVTVCARVARKKIVPPQFLGLAHGGLGLAVIDPSPAFFDFVAEISPEQAEAVSIERAKQEKRAGETDIPREGTAGAGSNNGAVEKPAPAKRFRIHAVETTSGKKSTYLVSCATEDEASAQVIEQLGVAWQVLFIERI
ncbi:MAG: PilZ domain-containing protein [Myxococcota bacterium]